MSAPQLPPSPESSTGGIVQINGQLFSEDSLGDRLLLILNEAGLQGRATWTDIYSAMTILDRYEHLADHRWWTVYQALAPKPAERHRIVAPRTSARQAVRW